MRKAIYLPLLLLLFSGCGNKPQVTGWNYNGLNGKVKHTTVKVSVAMLRNNQWTSLGGNNVYEIRTADYSEDGRLLKEEVFSKDSLKDKTVYTYSNGVVDSIVTYNGAGGIKYFYKVTAAEPLFNVQTWQFYNRDTLRNTETLTWKDGLLQSKNSEGRSGTHTTTTYQRDAQGNLTKVNTEMRKEGTAPFIYDENYVYTNFDAHHNWVTRFNTYSGKDRFGSAEERIIEYYPD